MDGHVIKWRDSIHLLQDDTPENIDLYKVQVLGSLSLEAAISSAVAP